MLQILFIKANKLFFQEDFFSNAHLNLKDLSRASTEHYTYFLFKNILINTCILYIEKD